VSELQLIAVMYMLIMNVHIRRLDHKNETRDLVINVFKGDYNLL